jgi:hypothetical protein
MRKRFSEEGYDLGTGDGPIVTPHFSDKDKLYAIAHGLFKRGIHAVPVTYPIVEMGRGRIRFICSASHTRDDVDRTLEALIDAEREAEQVRLIGRSHVNGQLAQRTGDSADDGRSGRSAVEAWAHAFCNYARETRARTPGAIPNLTISIGLPGHRERVTVAINERDVIFGVHEPTHAPFCSLLFMDYQAVSAFCLSDVQELLDNVIKGACVLSGHVEPFIWLIARMPDWQGGSVC